MRMIFMIVEKLDVRHFELRLAWPPKCSAMKQPAVNGFFILRRRDHVLRQRAHRYTRFYRQCIKKNCLPLKIYPNFAMYSLTMTGAEGVLPEGCRPQQKGCVVIESKENDAESSYASTWSIKRSWRKICPWAFLRRNRWSFLNHVYHGGGQQTYQKGCDRRGNRNKSWGDCTQKIDRNTCTVEYHRQSRSK